MNRCDLDDGSKPKRMIENTFKFHIMNFKGIDIRRMMRESSRKQLEETRKNNPEYTCMLDGNGFILMMK